MKIKNILNLCIVALLAVVLSSCDENADNVKMVRRSGFYNGDIYAELYMPDYDMEQYLSLINPDGMPYLCADTVRGGQVEVHFATDDLAFFSLNKVSGMTFKIPFVMIYEDYDVANLMFMYDGGSFAKFFYAIQAHYNNGELNKDEFYRFARIMETIEDTISIDGFSVQPFRMREKGSIYSTYDYEQNSVYVRAGINTFNYSRKTNITEALEYVDKHFSTVLNTDDIALINALKAGLKLQGTVSDASGWLSMSYSNYRPFVDITIDSATGILDVLTQATFGKYKLDNDGKPLKDHDGNLVPNKSLQLEIWYSGTIANMDAYQRIEE